MCLFPLLRADLKWATRGVVTASDASLRGGGVCRSTGLSLEGLTLCEELRGAVENYTGVEVVL
eukprot:5475503-Amphidinium_carterae.1